MYETSWHSELAAQAWIHCSKFLGLLPATPMSESERSTKHSTMKSPLDVLNRFPLLVGQERPAADGEGIAEVEVVELEVGVEIEELELGGAGDGEEDEVGGGGAAEDDEDGGGTGDGDELEELGTGAAVEDELEDGTGTTTEELEELDEGTGTGAMEDGEEGMGVGQELMVLVTC